MSDSLAGLAGWASDVIQSLGYVGVAVLIALENLLPPIPSEVILPLAGFLVGRGRFEFLPVLVASTAGSLSGALALYGLGRWLGEERPRRFVKRFGRFVLLDEADLDRAVGWFERYRGRAGFFGRLVPGIRSLISVPAGVERMPIWRFVAYTLGGSALWNALLIGLGCILGDQWALVRQYAQALQYALLAAAVGAVAWFLWRRLGGAGDGGLLVREPEIGYGRKSPFCGRIGADSVWSSVSIVGDPASRPDEPPVSRPGAGL